MRLKKKLGFFLAGIAVCIFGGMGFLLAVEKVPFFESLKTFFLMALQFGGFLIAFFLVSTLILWIIDLLGKLSAQNKT